MSGLAEGTSVYGKPAGGAAEQPELEEDEIEGLLKFGGPATKATLGERAKADIGSAAANGGDLPSRFMGRCKCCAAVVALALVCYVVGLASQWVFPRAARAATPASDVPRPLASAAAAMATDLAVPLLPPHAGGRSQQRGGSGAGVFGVPPAAALGGGSVAGVGMPVGLEGIGGPQPVAVGSSSGSSSPSSGHSDGPSGGHGGGPSSGHSSSNNPSSGHSSSPSGGHSGSSSPTGGGDGYSAIAASPSGVGGASAGKANEKRKLPDACRLRRLKMPPEDALPKIFKKWHDLERKWFSDSLHLAPLVPAGTKAVVVLDSLATMTGKYAAARQLHRQTWMQRPGICSPKRNEDPNCVLFPIFPMTAGGTLRKPCSLTLKEIEASEAIAEEDNRADPERTESFLLKWEEPYVQPWWTPRPLAHDEPRHLVMFKTALVRYPWMTHFVKQDLDTYPYFPWGLPEIAKPAQGPAAATRHVYLGQWKTTGVWPGPRKKMAKGIHRLGTDCKIPSGNGGNRAGICWHGEKNRDWGGNFWSADFASVNDAWCNDWSMTDFEKGCFKPWTKGLGLCSGFMYGHFWSYSRSLAQAIVDSRDKYIDSMRGNDFAHSDIRVGAWVNRIALKANQSVELRALCGTAPWRHFG